MEKFIIRMQQTTESFFRHKASILIVYLVGLTIVVLQLRSILS